MIQGSYSRSLNLQWIIQRLEQINQGGQRHRRSADRQSLRHCAGGTGDEFARCSVVQQRNDGIPGNHDLARDIYEGVKLSWSRLVQSR